MNQATRFFFFEVELLKQLATGLSEFGFASVALPRNQEAVGSNPAGHFLFFSFQLNSIVKCH